MDKTNTPTASTPSSDTERLAISHTEMTELLLPDDTNSLGRALGGTVLHWMDVCGAIAAMRFAGRQVVTASMEHVDFIAPIEVGEVATIEGYVFDTGRTSLDVTVEVQAADPRTGEHRQTTSSYLTFVALDDDEQPTSVPSLVCPSDEEAARRDRALEARLDQLEQVRARHET